MSGRHPFKNQPRDERAHGLIADYLGRFGEDSGVEQEIPGFASPEAANEGRLSIRRGARHFGVRAAAWVKDGTDGTASVTFRLHSAEQARRHVHQQAGGDPARLKYNPYASGAARSYERRQG